MLHETNPTAPVSLREALLGFVSAPPEKLDQHPAEELVRKHQANLRDASSHAQEASSDHIDLARRMFLGGEAIELSVLQHVADLDMEAQQRIIELQSTEPKID